MALGLGIIIIACLLVIIGLFIYSNKTHRVELSKDPNEENPLSLQNLHSTKEAVGIHTKEYIRRLYLYLLHLVIKLKRFTKTVLDRLIRKLSKLAFPDEKNILPAEENHFLNNAEAYKKEKRNKKAKSIE